MGKTIDCYGNKKRFKRTTPTTKFAALVNGVYMETTAVSKAQAAVHLRLRYNKENGFQSHVFQKMEFTDVRKPVVEPITLSNKLRKEPKEKKLTKEQVVYRNPDQIKMFE